MPLYPAVWGMPPHVSTQSLFMLSQATSLNEFQHQRSPGCSLGSLMALKIPLRGSSLAVQWLGLSAFTAEVPGSIPGQGTKIPQAVQCGKNKTKQKQNEETKTTLWDFPGDPVVKNPCFHCREHGFNPWSGN